MAHKSVKRTEGGEFPRERQHVDKLDQVNKWGPEW